MKIDFLINKMSGGGAERVVSIIANYLVSKNYDVRIITFQGSDKYELDPSVRRIKLHNYLLFRSVTINGFFSLLKFYRTKKNRPDIISSHINLLGYSTILIAKIFKIPIVVSEHMNHVHNRTFAKNVLWNLLYPFVDGITVLTNFDYAFFAKRNSNVTVMPNPCPFDIPETLPNKLVRRKEILAVGSLDRYNHKGFDNLILIASNVLKRNEGWKLRIVGDGENGLTILKTEAKKHGIDDKIVFDGFRNDIQEIMATSEIFILCSRYEGLPMVLIEAMSQGMCCISYNCVSGPSDIITNDFNGLLIENQNMELMSLKLNQLINDENYRNDLRINGPKSVKKFSTEIIGKKWEDLIRKVSKN